jgi:hypothetical protein
MKNMPSKEPPVPVFDGTRALIVSDVDEVALEFLDPFNAFLKENGYELLPRSFRLSGNIVSLAGGNPASPAAVANLMEGFWRSHDSWQRPVRGAAEALHRLSAVADIVFLTAMPPKHYAVRRALLDRYDLTYPLVARESSKGAFIRELHADSEHPVILIDDMIYNLKSVREHLPHSMAIHFMANDIFRAMAPAPEDDMHIAADWNEITRLVLDHLSA